MRLSNYLVLPSCERRMFCGLRSRCTIPLLVMADMAPAAQRKKLIIKKTSNNN
jgi:hypothetical protein